MLQTLAATKKIIICAGPGGVGKTTGAAALAVVAARAGRKTLVCTIDPAPRLADALGLGTLGHDPRPLSAAASATLGLPTSDCLFAARLDTARTFNRLVDEQVTDPQMRRRIYENAIYRQITSTLTGSQEYAATLALHELHRSGGYDLIVLDTPPTAHALDFIEAPRRLAEAISSPAIQWFARPPSDAGLFSWSRLRAGPAMVLRRLGKFVGSRFLDDLGSFLLDFRDVLTGFLERARAVEALLRAPTVGFVLVLSPEVPAVNEALYFASRLRTAGLPLSGFIANRVLTAPGTCTPQQLQAALQTRPELADLTPSGHAEAAAALATVGAYVDQLATAQHREIARLRHDAPDVPITIVPLLTHDVSTLASLKTVGDHLSAPV